MAISEDLLHFIWKLRLYQMDSLLTVKGEFISVLNVGEHNENAGPDFLFSNIRIGDKEWHGSVEIHVKASDWYLHAHQVDSLYDNVILHVVWIDDRTVYYKNKAVIPTLQLSDYVSSTILWRYQELMNSRHWISCAGKIKDVNSIKIAGWLDRLAVDRLVEKSKIILDLHDQLNGDWERVFLIWVCRSFGFKVNADAFESLGMQLSLKLLKQYRQDKIKIEALLFGQSKFLDGDFSDAYPKLLQQEYRYLKKIHHLTEIQLPWKLLRMRPFNFPTMRIAQLAQLLQKESFQLSRCLELEDLHDFRSWLQMLELDVYWESHFLFDKVAHKLKKNQLSKQSQDILIINIMIIFQFAYGLYFQRDELMEKALRWFEELPKENNSMITKFENLGIFPAHAAHSQALLYLKKYYCDQKQCLKCGIALQILKTNP